MNRENVAALAEKIRKVGFEKATPWLVRRICFSPKHFIIEKTVQKGKDRVVFQFHFERRQDSNSYAFDFYDALLQKDTEIESPILDRIDTAFLDKQMLAINWREVFSPEKEFADRDEMTLWAEAEAIESIVNDLLTLEAGQGKEVAQHLKLKHWPGTLYQEFTGGGQPVKSRFEISQRFFTPDDNDIISWDEAYRFLQNKWLEKVRQSKMEHPIQNGHNGQGRDDVTQASSDITGTRKTRRKAPRKGR